MIACIWWCCDRGRPHPASVGPRPSCAAQEGTGGLQCRLEPMCSGGICGSGAPTAPSCNFHGKSMSSGKREVIRMGDGAVAMCAFGGGGRAGERPHRFQQVCADVRSGIRLLATPLLYLEGIGAWPAIIRGHSLLLARLRRLVGDTINRHKPLRPSSLFPGLCALRDNEVRVLLASAHQSLGAPRHPHAIAQVEDKPQLPSRSQGPVTSAGACFG